MTSNVTGKLRTLCEKLGTKCKPTYVVMAIATIKGICRPTFTMMDKHEDYETKKYTAIREGLTEVIAIPASGGKKMVYGYCTDQVDGTSFLGGLFDADATEFPYSSGLAIGGSSGNLLWKGTKVATTADLPGNATTSKAGLMSAADKTKLDGLQSGGSFDFDALIDASGFSYTYTKSSNTHTETIKQGSTTYATRTSTKNTSTGAWTVAIVCSAAGVNVTKTYTPSSTGWTVA